MGALTGPGAPFAVVRGESGGLVYASGPRTLREFVETTWAYGDRPFLVCGERTWAYGEFFASSAALAGRLVGEYGLRGGDRVCIAMNDRPEWQVAFWAVQLAGLVAVPVDPSWGEEPFSYVVGDCAPRLVFAERDRLLPSVAGWASRAGARVVSLEEEREGGSGGFDPGVAPPDLDVRAEDPSTIFYTGTGTERAARPGPGAVATQLAQAGAVMNARFHAAVADLGRGRVPGFGPVAAIPLTYPFFHPASFADVYRAMAVGGSLVMKEKERERDNPEKSLPVGLDLRLAETSGPVLLDGRPTPVTEVRVAGPRGASLPDGEVGELWVRGQSLAIGYWGDPQVGPGPASGPTPTPGPTPAPGAFPDAGGGWFMTGLRAALGEGRVVRWDGDAR